MKIALKFPLLIPISVIKVPICESYRKNLTLRERLKLPVSIDREMAALSILNIIYQKSFSLADIFPFHKYQVIAFFNVLATSKRQQSSGKFRIWKVLIVKWPSFQFSAKFEKKIVMSASERDISCYIFQNISRTKLIVIHEKIPDIITNR